MFKIILLPTDGSEYSLTAWRYAIELAKVYDAVVHGLSVINVKLMQGQFVADLSNVVRLDRNQVEEVLQDKGNTLLDSLRKSCEGANVSCTSSMAGCQC